MFPFSAIVGHDDAKLALLLNAVDPAIGGVLLRGHKGTAKSTLARSITALLGDDAAFVELPIGASEDRVTGSLDLTSALTAGEMRFVPGLIAAAHHGVLYVDEVNLLPDHLVDVLLDVAASGINRVEREGVSHTHAAEFLLVGSMNPEEGELRPQFLDRFGMAVALGSLGPAERAEAVARRLGFDADAERFCASWAPAEAALEARLAAARLATLPAEVIRAVTELCASVGAEGLRADLVICRAAAALAGWEERDRVLPEDVRRVAPFALAHRARHHPLEEQGLAPETLAEALDEALAPLENDGAGGVDPERIVAPDPPSRVSRLETARGGSASLARGRRSLAPGSRGHLVGDQVPGAGGPTTVALGATVRRALARQVSPGPVQVEAEDLREAIREERVGNLVVIVVDASGSMGAERRMAAAKGAVLSLLVDAYQRRDRVALVTFRGDGASVVLRPTGSIEVARARLTELATGGRTPLAAGLHTALEVALAGQRTTERRALVVLVTDGRATSAPDGRDPLEAAQDAAGALRRSGLACVVVDAEDGPARLGLAPALAESMGARFIELAELSGPALSHAVREALAGPGQRVGRL